MTDLADAHVLILATDGFEQAELFDALMLRLQALAK